MRRDSGHQSSEAWTCCQEKCRSQGGLEWKLRCHVTAAETVFGAVREGWEGVQDPISRGPKPILGTTFECCAADVKAAALAACHKDSGRFVRWGHGQRN